MFLFMLQKIYILQICSYIGVNLPDVWYTVKWEMFTSRKFSLNSLFFRWRHTYMDAYINRKQQQQWRSFVDVTQSLFLHSTDPYSTLFCMPYWGMYSHHIIYSYIVRMKQRHFVLVVIFIWQGMKQRHTFLEIIFIRQSM